MRSSRARYLGEGIIEVPLKASTRTRLHELAHKRLGHEPGDMPRSEFVDKELDAEIWAWETMDKAPTSRVGIPALLALVTDYSTNPGEALFAVVRGLRRKGISTSRRDREELYAFATGEASWVNSSEDEEVKL